MAVEGLDPRSVDQLEVDVYLPTDGLTGVFLARGAPQMTDLKWNTQVSKTVKYVLRSEGSHRRYWTESNGVANEELI